MNAPLYEFTIRTPEAQARHVRRCRAKRMIVAVAVVGAFFIPAGIADAAPAICAHTWVC
jgi:hypothetical protein